MLCFCSDKWFKVAHLFAHSENLALSFTFHLLWDTLSGALSVQLLRTESINRRWWSNPNRGQRLNVFVARFARGGRYHSRAGDKWRMHYSEHTSTQTIFLHNQNSSSRNTHKLLLQFQGKYNMLQCNMWVSAVNHDASEIKSKHEGEDSMFFLGTSAGTQVLLHKCSSSSRSYKNTEYGGNKKIGKYEICMKYFDMSRCMVI